jgi:hypothetical protein
MAKITNGTFHRERHNIRFKVNGHPDDITRVARLFLDIPGAMIQPAGDWWVNVCFEARVARLFSNWDRITRLVDAQMVMEL